MPEFIRKHVKVTFESATILAIVGTIAGSVYSYGGLAKQVETNTQTAVKQEQRILSLEQAPTPADVAAIKAELEQMNERLGRIEDAVEKKK